MLSLTDRRILITRPAGQASPLAAALDSLGAITILIPTIELAPPASWCALDAALACLRSFDLTVFTSANAVQAFAERARQLHLSPHPKRIAVIGPATAKAVLAANLRPDDPNLLLPPRYVPEALIELLLPLAAGAQILLPRAAVAANDLPEALTAAGANVTLADTYRTITPPRSIEALTTLFRTAPPDAITFTSASTAQNLATLLQTARLTIPPGTVLASIGPVTSRAMRALRLEPTLEAPEATIPALAQALATHFRTSV